MDPITLSLLLNAIPSIIQGGIGASQLRKASKIEAQNQRPEAQVSPAISDLVKYSYGRTFANDVPGGELYRNEIKGATSAGLRAASELGSGAEAYGMLGQLVGREQNAFSDLAKTTAQQVAGYQKDYMNTLPMLGEEQNRVWNWNEAQPYLQAARTAQQLRDSGTKNLYSGASNLFGSTAETVNPEFSSSLLLGDGDIGKKSNVTMEQVLKAIQELNKNKTPFSSVGPGE
jgi:hypothetical protein